MIRVHDKLIRLGVVEHQEKAHKSYCEATVKYFGEFARFE